MLLFLAYAASTAFCAVECIGTVWDYGESRPIPCPISLMPGLAGFAAFPFINSALAVALIINRIGWNAAGRPDRA